MSDKTRDSLLDVYVTDHRSGALCRTSSLLWRAGTDKGGSTPRLRDGLPAFLVSTCGHYSIAAVMLDATDKRWYEAAYLVNAVWQQLGARIELLADAKALCEQHAFSLEQRGAA